MFFSMYAFQLKFRFGILEWQFILGKWTLKISVILRKSWKTMT